MLAFFKRHGDGEMRSALRQSRAALRAVAAFAFATLAVARAHAALTEEELAKLARTPDY